MKTFIICLSVLVCSFIFTYTFEAISKKAKEKLKIVSFNELVLTSNTFVYVKKENR